MIKQFLVPIVVSLIAYCSGEAFTQAALPGWDGEVIIDCESTLHWTVEYDSNSSGSVNSVMGFIGSAVQLNWNIANGNWVQAKYTFQQTVDLSDYDIFGLSLRGSSSTANRVSVMFADTNGVFFGVNFDGINTVARWMINLPIPKKMFYHFFTIPADSTLNEIDWSQINRFFVVVKRPDSLTGGGTGQLTIDHLQSDRAVDWSRQTDFDTVVVSDSSAIYEAISYVMNQQEPTGLFVSWKEEAEPKAHLYDQALVLVLLTREGEWGGGLPLNNAAEKADSLVNSLNSYQYSDGHWPRTWNPVTGEVLLDDEWVGDQAWWIMALKQYYEKSQDILALNAALRGADWIIDSCGVIVPSTEGTVDIWWALISTGHFNEADSVEGYLLSTVWDDSLKYWWRGYSDPVVAMDAATWVGEFAKTARVDRHDMAKAALSFVRRTLITTDNGGLLFGFDGLGPVSIWCEGTAQYVSAGGEDAQEFLNMLLTLQRSDGGMPGSTDNWSGTSFGWLTTWTGLAPTAWLYFALTGSPFEEIAFPTPVIEKGIESPQKYALDQNYPNPFNPATTIQFSLPQAEFVTLKIYNILGEEVAALVKGRLTAGKYEYDWNASGHPSGIYLYRIQAGNFVDVKKTILLR